MRCEDVSTELAARAHDEDPVDDPDLLEHLERCPECAGHEDDLEPVRDFWRRARDQEIDLGDDAWSRLRAQIQEESRPRRRSPLLLVLPAVAAAAAILVFALLVEPALDDALALEPQYGQILVDGDPCPAGRTTRLETGATVANGGESPARIDLDTTSIVLSKDAAFCWMEKRRFEVISGTILVRTSRPMTVTAAGVRVDVLGTEFSADRTGTGLSVQVIEGRVRLTGAERSVDLSAGTRSYCPADGSPGEPVRAALWPALDWMGAPRLELDVLSAGDDAPIELLLLVETDAREEIPLRPFTPASADFLLEITDPDGNRFPLKILPDMVVECSRPRVIAPGSPSFAGIHIA